MAPQTIGRYRILRELGRGATATVYLARDPGSGRQVAVKIFTVAYTAAPDFAARFEQTLKALAGLEHPYLVTPHDHGGDGDQFFVVTRYLPGGTLADRMDGRPMLLAEVVPILQRLSEALDAAHTAHLLHGDLHPADVLFDLRERAFLADLGLAQLIDPVAGPSPTGTAAYMSPEQIGGQPIDGRADVYALGIMLFEMLTGRQPYSGPGPQDLLRQHLEQPVPQLSAAALTRLVLPLEFNLVIARALAKNRDHRYPTAGVLAEAVRTMFLVAPADTAPEPAPTEPPPLPAVQVRTPPPPAAPETAARPADVVPDAGPAATAMIGPGAEIIASAADVTLAPASAGTPPTAPPLTPTEGKTQPAAAPEPAVGPALDADAPPPVLAELVREPLPATAPPRRGLGPGSLLLGLAGIGLVLAFLAYYRWPAILAIVAPPTATATATATATSTATLLPTSTASATPPQTSTASPSATASPSPSRTMTPTHTATATVAPSDTPTVTGTPTRRPTLPPFTATPTLGPAGSAATNTSSAPTQSHLGPPPTRAP